MKKMKKILLPVILLVFTSSIFAQTFDFGIKAGINSQKITTDSYKGISGYTFSDFKSDAKMGYNIGAFARIGGNKLYIQPELLYSIRKGNTNVTLASSSGGLTAGAYTQSFDIKSVQVPLLLGYKLIDLKLASIRVFTGPAMSVILKDSQVKLTSAGGVAVDPTLYDPKTFKDNVWNWQLGGGVDVGPLVVDVRYEWGLTNVSDGDVTKIGFINKSNILTFSLGYKFF
jgi:hypothetical protein